MTTARKKVLFLKNGAQYGYAVEEGDRGWVYEVDIPYLVNLGVIKRPGKERPRRTPAAASETGTVVPRQNFWQKLFTR